MFIPTISKADCRIWPAHNFNPREICELDWFSAFYLWDPLKVLMASWYVYIYMLFFFMKNYIILIILILHSYIIDWYTSNRMSSPSSSVSGVHQRFNLGTACVRCARCSVSSVLLAAESHATVTCAAPDGPAFISWAMAGDGEVLKLGSQSFFGSKSITNKVSIFLVV